MNRLAFKWIASQRKGITPIVKVGIPAENVACDLPQPRVVSIQRRTGLKANLFHNFLVEVIKQLFARGGFLGRDLSFQFFAQLVELKLDLLRRAALLVNRRDPFFEVYTRLNGT